MKDCVKILGRGTQCITSEFGAHSSLAWNSVDSLYQMVLWYFSLMNLSLVSFAFFCAFGHILASKDLKFAQNSNMIHCGLQISICGSLKLFFF